MTIASVIRSAWAIWRLWCFRCLLIMVVNKCPSWLWEALFKRGAYGFTLGEDHKTSGWG